MRTAFRALIPSLCILLAAPALGPSPRASESAQQSGDAIPGNGLIAYTDGTDLFTMRRDGTRVRRVPLPAEHRPGAPRWSPDGTKIVFNSDIDDETDIYIFNRKTGNTRAVIMTEGSDHSPDWSPDGKRLVYVSYRTGDDELYIINLRTGAQRRLTNHPGLDVSPAWGPGGKFIAFTRCEPTGTKPEIHLRLCRIALYNLKRGTVRFLTPKPKQNRFGDRDPTWSPRGGWLAFVRVRDSGEFLVKMRSDGTGVKRLGRQAWCCPSWSPNGRRILYVRLLSGEYYHDEFLRMVRPDGSGDRRITPRGEPDEWGPDWQPRPR